MIGGQISNTIEPFGWALDTRPWVARFRADIPVTPDLDSEEWNAPLAVQVYAVRGTVVDIPQEQVRRVDLGDGLPATDFDVKWLFETEAQAVQWGRDQLGKRNQKIAERENCPPDSEFEVGARIDTVEKFEQFEAGIAYQLKDTPNVCVRCGVSTAGKPVWVVLGLGRHCDSCMDLHEAEMKAKYPDGIPLPKEPSDD